MSGDAVKAFVYLLSESWLQEPRATLPGNDVELASMARISDVKFAEIKHEIMQHFCKGKCREHLDRLYNDTLLEISRKYEKNQRFNNKNAKRTRYKRVVNAPLDNDNDSDIDTDNTSENTNTKGAGYPPAFEQFWAAYPRRVGKGAASKAWAHIPAGTLPAILEALQWQRQCEQWTKDGGQYVPHPATYLNSKRWEDDKSAARPVRQRWFMQ